MGKNKYHLVVLPIIPTIVASIIIHIFLGVACIVLAIMHFVKQDTLILAIHVLTLGLLEIFHSPFLMYLSMVIKTSEFVNPNSGYARMYTELFKIAWYDKSLIFYAVLILFEFGWMIYGIFNQTAYYNYYTRFDTVLLFFTCFIFICTLLFIYVIPLLVVYYKHPIFTVNNQKKITFCSYFWLIFSSTKPVTEGNCINDFTKSEEIINVDNHTNNNNKNYRKSKIKRIINDDDNGNNENNEICELESGLKTMKTPLLCCKDENMSKLIIDRENNRYSKSSFEPIDYSNVQICCNDSKSECKMKRKRSSLNSNSNSHHHVIMNEVVDK